VTAFSGRNISEDSLASSTAILAVPYAVLQAVSLPWVVFPSLDVSRVLNVELTGRATSDDKTVGALGFLRDTRSCPGSVGCVGVGVETAGCFGLRKRGITKEDVQINRQ